MMSNGKSNPQWPRVGQTNLPARRWKPGESGNPGGRPKAVETLVQIMRDKNRYCFRAGWSRDGTARPRPWQGAGRSGDQDRSPR
jgi:hypothetical protein